MQRKTFSGNTAFTDEMIDSVGYGFILLPKFKPGVFVNTIFEFVFRFKKDRKENFEFPIAFYQKVKFEKPCQRLYLSMLTTAAFSDFEFDLVLFENEHEEMDAPFHRLMQIDYVRQIGNITGIVGVINTFQQMTQAAGQSATVNVNGANFVIIPAIASGGTNDANVIVQNIGANTAVLGFGLNPVFPTDFILAAPGAFAPAVYKFEKNFQAVISSSLLGAATWVSAIRINN